jgi:hypothetical protein
MHVPCIKWYHIIAFLSCKSLHVSDPRTYDSLEDLPIEVLVVYVLYLESLCIYQALWKRILLALIVKSKNIMEVISKEIKYSIYFAQELGI